MAAINAINKAPVRSAKAYVARAKKEEAVLPPKPKAKTNEELVDEIPYINHPCCTPHSYRTQLLSYLNSPTLQGLLGTPNRNDGFNMRPWTREDMLLFYTWHCAKIHKIWLQQEERRKAIEEKKKNWNPTDVEKLAFMKTYMGLRDKLTNEAMDRNDTFCTCCGVMHVDLGVGTYRRVRWEVVTADGVASANHNPESLRIKDAATGKDMIISWEDA